METGSGNASGSSADSAAKTTSSSGDGNNRQGCGCVSATSITVRVTPTTGGQFDLLIPKSETIENLKKLISKKLKVPKERICLLHRDRQLREGTLTENQLMEGSRLTLLPSVETGLLAQRPEQSVMQALESLNDSQVNDFLSGKAPLNLTMRLGDHMMLIQLQLSTVTPSSSRRSASSASTAAAAAAAAASTDPAAAAATSAATTSTSATPPSTSSLLASRNHLASSLSDVINGMAKNFTSSSSSNCGDQDPARMSAVKISSVSAKRTSSASNKVVATLETPKMATATTSSSTGVDAVPKRVNEYFTDECIRKFGARSSLSATSSNDAYKSTPDPKLVFASSYCPTDTALSSPESTPSPQPQPPTQKTADHTSNLNRVTSTGFKFPSTPTSTSIFKPLSSFYSTSLSSNSLSRQPSSLSSVSDASNSKSTSSTATPVAFTPSPLKSLENATKKIDVGGRNKTLRTAEKGDDKATPTTSTSSSSSTTTSTSTTTTTTTVTPPCKCDPPAKPVLDTRALAEASRNLTQTLKQLSSEVLTSRADPAEDTARARRQGAIIESMHHHGKGVYSGTFSGTLNPALQDRYGRPKRDISTIIHILNDLLCATPQYRRHAATTVEVLPKTGSQPETMDFPEDSLLRENQATRGKLEQLRLIMEERRARRRARREARSAPYTTQWSAKSETLNAQSPVEPMDTGDSDLCDMNPPEPVVA